MPFLIYCWARNQVPYRVLNFLTSYINYGGRVTDYIDLRTIDVLMRTFYTPRVCKGLKKQQSRRFCRVGARVKFR